MRTRGRECARRMYHLETNEVSQGQNTEWGVGWSGGGDDTMKGSSRLELENNFESEFKGYEFHCY